MAEQHKRLAVLAGCNYPKLKGDELYGCINDVLAMQETLVNRFGFDRSHIELLIDDEPGSLRLPTGENIKRALKDMVDKAVTGDVLFFHYSGHGILIAPSLGENSRRMQEAIVPCDFNLIFDVDFRQLVNRIPKGATFTMLSDSCHSGGLIDQEKEQIGPHSSPKNDVALPPGSKPKTIPLQALLEHLVSTCTGMNPADIGTHLLQSIITSIDNTIAGSAATHLLGGSITNTTTPADIGTHLLESITATSTGTAALGALLLGSFGADASLLYRLPRNAGGVDGRSDGDLQDAGILLSGCQADETSMDLNPEGGKAHGAFSDAVETVLKEGEGKRLSNREVVALARKVLEREGLGGEQHPCLYCSDANADGEFLNKT